MNSAPHDRKRGPWIVSFVILLALVGGFFLGGRFAYLPKDPADPSHGDWEWRYTTEPRLRVWISKDKFFIWREEAPRRLEELPARIKEHLAKHQSNVVSLSSDELARFEDMVYALDKFREFGFNHIHLETRPAPMPGPKGK